MEAAKGSAAAAAQWLREQRKTRSLAELQQRVKSMTSEKETLLEYYTQKFKRVKELEAQIAKLQAELADDNKNYTKLLQGVSNEAESKFVFAHAMTRSDADKDAEKGGGEALKYIKWLQTKLAALLGEAAAKKAVGKWFV